VDLEAVKAASTPDLISGAVGAAVNAERLIDDAELLTAGGRHGRAYAVAALAVEEAGKAASLTALAIMPAGLLAQAPVGRLLEWHQWKLMDGLLITAETWRRAVPFGAPTLAAQFAAMPPDQVAGILKDAQVLAQDVDRLKQRGLYADIDPGGQVRLPSEVTEADVAAQLGRARLAVSSASALQVPGTAALIANPPAEAIEFSRALVTAFAEAGPGRTPEAAAGVMLNVVGKLRQQTAASDARISSGSKRRGNV
jgi:AbiV family abortive infection protein